MLSINHFLLLSIILAIAVAGTDVVVNYDGFISEAAVAAASSSKRRRIPQTRGLGGNIPNDPHYVPTNDENGQQGNRPRRNPINLSRSRKSNGKGNSVPNSVWSSSTSSGSWVLPIIHEQQGKGNYYESESEKGGGKGDTNGKGKGLDSIKERENFHGGYGKGITSQSSKSKIRCPGNEYFSRSSKSFGKGGKGDGKSGKGADNIHTDYFSRSGGKGKGNGKGSDPNSSNNSYGKGKGDLRPRGHDVEARKEQYRELSRQIPQYHSTTGKGNNPTSKSTKGYQRSKSFRYDECDEINDGDKILDFPYGRHVDPRPPQSTISPMPTMPTMTTMPTMPKRTFQPSQAPTDPLLETPGPTVQPVFRPTEFPSISPITSTPPMVSSMPTGPTDSKMTTPPTVSPISNESIQPTAERISPTPSENSSNEPNFPSIPTTSPVPSEFGSNESSSPNEATEPTISPMPASATMSPFPSENGSNELPSPFVPTVSPMPSSPTTSPFPNDNEPSGPPSPDEPTISPMPTSPTVSPFPSENSSNELPSPDVPSVSPMPNAPTSSPFPNDTEPSGPPSPEEPTISPMPTAPTVSPFPSENGSNQLPSPDVPTISPMPNAPSISPFPNENEPSGPPTPDEPTISPMPTAPTISPFPSQNGSNQPPAVEIPTISPMPNAPTISPFPNENVPSGPPLEDVPTISPVPTAPTISPRPSSNQSGVTVSPTPSNSNVMPSPNESSISPGPSVTFSPTGPTISPAPSELMPSAPAETPTPGQSLEPSGLMMPTETTIGPSVASEMNPTMSPVTTSPTITSAPTTSSSPSHFPSFTPSDGPRCITRSNLVQCAEKVSTVEPEVNCDCFNFCGDEFVGCCRYDEECKIDCLGVLVAGCERPPVVSPPSPTPPQPPRPPAPPTTPRPTSPTTEPTAQPTSMCLVGVNQFLCPNVTMTQEPIEGCDCYNYCNSEFNGCCGFFEAVECEQDCNGIVVSGCQLEGPPVMPPPPTSSPGPTITPKPSISPEPSPGPTVSPKPSQSPMPSFGPTISPMPTVSQRPSTSFPSMINGTTILSGAFNSMEETIPLFALQFILLRSETHTLESDLQDLLAISGAFLNAHFLDVYDGSEVVVMDTGTEVISSEDDEESSVVLVVFQSTVWFQFNSPKVPGNELLNDVENAFSGSNLEGYLGMVQALPPINKFSSTIEVYLISPYAGIESTIKRATPWFAIIAASVVTSLVAVGVIVRRNRFRKSQNNNLIDFVVMSSDKDETATDFLSTTTSSRIGSFEDFTNEIHDNKGWTNGYNLFSSKNTLKIGSQIDPIRTEKHNLLPQQINDCDPLKEFFMERGIYHVASEDGLSEDNTESKMEGGKLLTHIPKDLNEDTWVEGSESSVVSEMSEGSSTEKNDSPQSQTTSMLSSEEHRRHSCNLTGLKIDRNSTVVRNTDNETAGFPLVPSTVLDKAKTHKTKISEVPKKLNNPSISRTPMGSSSKQIGDESNNFEEKSNKCSSNEKSISTDAPISQNAKLSTTQSHFLATKEGNETVRCPGNDTKIVDIPENLSFRIASPIDLVDTKASRNESSNKQNQSNIPGDSKSITSEQIESENDTCENLVQGQNLPTTSLDEGGAINEEVPVLTHNTGNSSQCRGINTENDKSTSSRKIPFLKFLSSVLGKSNTRERLVSTEMKPLENSLVSESEVHALSIQTKHQDKSQQETNIPTADDTIASPAEFVTLKVPRNDETQTIPSMSRNFSNMSAGRADDDDNAPENKSHKKVPFLKFLSNARDKTAASSESTVSKSTKIVHNLEVSKSPQISTHTESKPEEKLDEDSLVDSRQHLAALSGEFVSTNVSLSNEAQTQSALIGDSSEVSVDQTNTGNDTGKSQNYEKVPYLKFLSTALEKAEGSESEIFEDRNKLVSPKVSNPSSVSESPGSKYGDVPDEDYLSNSQKLSKRPSKESIATDVAPNIDKMQTLATASNDGMEKDDESDTEGNQSHENEKVPFLKFLSTALEKASKPPDNESSLVSLLSESPKKFDNPIVAKASTSTKSTATQQTSDKDGHVKTEIFYKSILHEVENPQSNTYSVAGKDISSLSPQPPRPPSSLKVTDQENFIEKTRLHPKLCTVNDDDDDSDDDDQYLDGSDTVSSLISESLTEQISTNEIKAVPQQQQQPENSSDGCDISLSTISLENPISKMKKEPNKGSIEAPASSVPKKRVSFSLNDDRNVSLHSIAKSTLSPVDNDSKNQKGNVKKKRKKKKTRSLTKNETSKENNLYDSLDQHGPIEPKKSCEQTRKSIESVNCCGDNDGDCSSSADATTNPMISSDNGNGHEGKEPSQSMSLSNSLLIPGEEGEATEGDSSKLTTMSLPLVETVKTRTKIKSELKKTKGGSNKKPKKGSSSGVVSDRISSSSSKTAHDDNTVDDSKSSTRNVSSLPMELDEIKKSLNNI